MSEFTAGEMNDLQLNGIISDLCVDSQDVAEPDRQAAIEWLRKRSRLASGELFTQ